jgi:hypothetical protein
MKLNPETLEEGQRIVTDIQYKILKFDNDLPARLHKIQLWINGFEYEGFITEDMGIHTGHDPVLKANSGIYEFQDLLKFKNWNYYTAKGKQGANSENEFYLVFNKTCYIILRKNIHEDWAFELEKQFIDENEINVKELKNRLYHHAKQYK